jgi:hypothetical protein
MTPEARKTHPFRHVCLLAALFFAVGSSSLVAQAQNFSISGHVTDGFGNAINSANVNLSSVSGSGVLTPVATTTSDSQGVYSLRNLAAGNYALNASLPGRTDTLTSSVSINNLNGDVTKDLQILFFVTYHFLVRDSAGNGIAGVCIDSSALPLSGCGAFSGTSSFGILNLGLNVPITKNAPPVKFTPEKPGYAFTPPSLTFNFQDGDQNVFFTGAPTGIPISFIQFNSSFYSAGEGDGSVNITVTRTGDTSTAVSADYTTADTPSCNQKTDYIMKSGNLSFAPGETSKTFSVLLIDNAIVQGNKTFTMRLSNPTGGASLGDPRVIGVFIIDNDTATTAINPIDSASYFVREQYFDFLNRFPDQSGWNFWTGIITPCGNDPDCIAVNRVNVSGAFFLSTEFQQTGYLVERMYKAAYGDAPGNSTLSGSITVPIVRFNEFINDTQQIGQGVVVNQGNWQQQLDDNKNTFAASFVQRQRFTTAFPASMSAAQFVDALNSNAGNPLSTADRNQLVSDLNSGVRTRAQVLRALAENPKFTTSEFNRAFVLMQYFGYLRRNPNDAPDADHSGYDFWLKKMIQFGGDYAKAEMVKAFINSDEYRHRFGP